MFKIEISVNKETLAAINGLAAAIASQNPAQTKTDVDALVEEHKAKQAEQQAAAKKAIETPSPADKKLAETKAKKAADAKAKKEAAAKKKAEAEAKAKEEAEAKAAEEKAQAEAAAKKKSDDAAAEAEPVEEAAEEPDDERVAPTVGVGQIRATLVAFGECYGKAKVVEVLQNRFNKTQLGQLDKSQYGDLYLALDAETEALGDAGIDPDCYEALLEALDACGGE